MADRGSVLAQHQATGTRTAGPYSLLGAAALVLMLVALATFPTPDPEPTPPPKLLAAVLTPDGSDTFDIVARRGTITATAPATNVGTNLRTAFWFDDAPVEQDGLVCATWAAASSEVVQEGLALRIAQASDGSVRLVSVTKNVTVGANWLFNVHVFDTADASYTPIGKVDLARTFELPGDPPTVVPLPWRVCARIEGSTVAIKAWRRAEPEPSWRDPAHSGRVELPDGAPESGRFGWYVGHIHPGMSAVFTELADRDGVVETPVVAAAVVAPDLGDGSAR
jgi:hypothetical protein